MKICLDEINDIVQKKKIILKMEVSYFNNYFIWPYTTKRFVNDIHLSFAMFNCEIEFQQFQTPHSYSLPKTSTSTTSDGLLP